MLNKETKHLDLNTCSKPVLNFAAELRKSVDVKDKIKT
jgi:hypothetical protein